MSRITDAKDRPEAQELDEKDFIEAPEKGSSESYAEYYRRTRKYQLPKALFAAWGIHVALVILVCMATITLTRNERIIMTVIPGYMFFGWIPLLMLVPFLRKRLD